MKKSVYLIMVLLLSASFSYSQTYSHLGAWYYGVSFQAMEDGYFDGVKLYTNAPDPGELVVWLYGPFDTAAECEGVVNGPGSASLDNANYLINSQVFSATDFTYTTTMNNQYSGDLYGLNYVQSDPDIQVTFESGLEKMRLQKNKFYLAFFTISNSTYTANEYRVTRLVSDTSFRIAAPSWVELENEREPLANYYDGLALNKVAQSKITICHSAPGNVNKTQTLEINQNAWPAHQAHGDIAGACPAVYSSSGLTDVNTTYYLSSTSPFQQSVAQPLDIEIKVDYINKWRGNGNSDWNNPNNWSRKTLPNEQNTVVVEAGYTSPYLNDSLHLDILVVEDGAELQVDSTHSIVVSDYLLNTGEIKGKVKLKGNYAQISAEGKIDQLEVDNNSGATLTGTTEIKEALILTDGILETDDNNLVLKSTETSTALIVHRTGTLNGQITLEQYVPQEGYGHHYLSSPLLNSSLSQLSDDFGFALTTPFPHLYYYDEPSSSWITPASSSDSMELGRGYTGYFPGNIIVDVTGYPNSGPTSIDVSADGNGWNFIGNPYPSPINWDSVAVPEGVSKAIYVWDHEHVIWGRYTSYIDGVSVNGGSNIIPMMQSFFVKALSNTSIYLDDACRIQDPNKKGVFFRKDDGDEILFKLELSGESYSQEIALRTKQNSTLEFDELYDAYMLNTGNEDGVEFASVLDDDKKLVINSIPYIDHNSVIPLLSSIGTPGTYIIQIIEEENLQEDLPMILYDSKLNVYHNLRGSAYTFISESGDNERRFRILFRLNAVGVDEIGAYNNYQVYKGNGSVNVLFLNPLKREEILFIYNNLGQEIGRWSLQQGISEFSVSPFMSNNNTLLIIAIGGQQSKLVY